MAYGVPFQSPPSRQSVAALLSRLSASGQTVPGMATGGQPAKPTATPFVAPQNPTVATPYTGDINHYGEGPEHDFFVDPAPPPPPPPKPTGGGTGGGGGGGGGNNQFPFGGDGSGSRNPWNQGTGGTGGGTGGQPPPASTTPAFASVAFSSPAGQNFLDVLKQHGIAAPAPQPALTSAAQKDAALANQGNGDPLAYFRAQNTVTPSPFPGPRPPGDVNRSASGAVRQWCGQSLRPADRRALATDLFAERR